MTTVESGKIKVTQRTRRQNTFHPATLNEGYGGGGRGNSYDYTHVGVEVDGKPSWGRNVHPYFRQIAMHTAGRLLLPRPNYESRIRRARDKAERKATKLRGK